MKWDGNLNWTDLAHDKYKWLAVANTVIGILVLQNAEFCLLLTYLLHGAESFLRS